MTPRLTVAIPFFDEERFLDGAIRSVLAQTFRDFELLLVDDGSRDGSLAIARAAETRDSRVRVLADGRRRHLAARLNQVVAEARGELVARMDADDVAHPARFERQLAVLDRTGADVVGTWLALVDDAGASLGVVEVDPAGASVAGALVRGLVPHATMVARRDFLRTVPYDESLTRAEDRDLWCRIAGRARVEVVPEVLYVVRVSTGEPRFLADYARGQADYRRVLLRYGPRAIGPVATARGVLASLAKTPVFAAARRVGIADRIVQRRGRPASESELARVREALGAAG